MGNQSVKGIGNVLSKEAINVGNSILPLRGPLSISTDADDLGKPAAVRAREDMTVEILGSLPVRNRTVPTSPNLTDEEDAKSPSFVKARSSIDLSERPSALPWLSDHLKSTPQASLVLKVVPSGSMNQALLTGSRASISAPSVQAGQRMTVHSEYAPASVADATSAEVSLELPVDDISTAMQMWSRRTFEPQPTSLHILTAFFSGCDVPANIRLASLPSTRTMDDGAATTTTATSNNSNNSKLPPLSSSSTFPSRAKSEPPQQLAAPYNKQQQQQLRILALALLKLRELTPALLENDIHAVTSDEHVLQSYLTTCFLLNENHATHRLRPALFQSIAEGTASLFVQFGGQGFNWLDELRRVYHTYPRVRPFIVSCAAAVASQVSSLEAQMLGFYTHGFDLMKWLEPQDVSAVPPADYLTSAPISYPMVCLAQLAHCLVTMTMLNMTPRDFHSYIRACSGHSQGVVSAVVLASSLSYPHFLELACNAMLYMFWHAARVQQVFPPVILPAKVLRECDEKPTPMMSVRGLPVSILKKYIGQVQGTYIALINGDAPPNIVVSGHPVSLNKLQTMLSTIQADPNQSQARIPFSKRKLEFSMSFLPVSVPFHSPLLAPAIPLIIADIQRLGIVLSSNDLRIPVYATSDGSNLQTFNAKSAAPSEAVADPSLPSIAAQDLELMHKLVEMQCVLPVNWARICRSLTVIPPFLEPIASTPSGAALNSPRVSSSDTETGSTPVMRTCTHVLDFGPGGLNGIARLTSQNVEGRGVQVVLAGLWHGSAGSMGSQAASMNKKGRVTFRQAMPGQSVLFDTRMDLLPRAVNWLEKFKPTLIDRQIFAVAAAAPAVSSSTTTQPDDVDGKRGKSLEICTKYTRLIGRPPIMVAGMTPSTVGEHFVSAVSNAGYIVELAGGGQTTEQMFKSRIMALTALLSPGESITVNLLFLNPRLWAFQFPMCCQLRKEGYPIDGVTIAAGVPSPDKADEILAALREAGIMRVGFKPGSVDAIRQVASIAARNPKSTIVVQWSGGRAGGHHSFEDQHQPILTTYGLLRDYDNVILVAGGGIGDTNSALPFITGEWSVALGYPPMPFDAIMMGSRVMIAKECPTEDSIKEMIARTPGVKDNVAVGPSIPSSRGLPSLVIPGKASAPNKAPSWEDSFEGEAGGILTVLSELGEPIHKIANRGTRFWREMDQKFFSLSKDALVTALAVPSNRDFIITGLNRDFQKPYFPRKADGTVVTDVRHMTYTEVAQRMLEIMHPHRVNCAHAKCPSHKAACSLSDQSRCDCECTWIDSSYHTRLREFLLRTIERFHNHPRASQPPQILPPSSDPVEADSKRTDTDTNKPEAKSEKSVFEIVSAHRSSTSSPSAHALIQMVTAQYPYCNSTLVSPEDEAFFHTLCRRRGKPVNFVPLIDADIKMWMKKDSLWYSENLSSVPDHDPERVMVLQGPVATQYATKANEPVAHILNELKDGLTRAVIALYRKAAKFSQPTALAPTPTPLSTSFFSTPSLALSVTSPSPASPAVSDVVRASQVTLTPPADKLGEESQIALLKWFDTLASVQPDMPAVQPEKRVTPGQPIASWRQSLFLVPFSIRNKLWVSNKVRHLFAPRAGQTVIVYSSTSAAAGLASAPNVDASDPVDRIAVFDTSTTGFGLSSAIPIVEALWNRASQTVSVVLRHAGASLASGSSPSRSPSPRSSSSPSPALPSTPAELVLRFSLSNVATYNYELGCLSFMLVEEEWAQRCRAISKFYSQLWLSPAQADAVLSTPLSTQESSSVSADSKEATQTRTYASFQTITSEAISRFRAVIGDPYVLKPSVGASASADYALNAAAIPAPVDYGIVLCWEPMIQSLMEGCDGVYGFSDLLALVHLSNEYILPSAPVLYTLPASGSNKEPSTLASSLSDASRLTAVGNHALETAMEMRSSDQILITSELKGVWDEAEGRVITVQARLFKLLPPSPGANASSAVRLLHCLDIVSRFAIRKGSTHKDVQFDSADHTVSAMSRRLFKLVKYSFQLPLKDDAAVAILLSKKWHSLSAQKVHKDDILRFELEVLEKLPNNGASPSSSGRSSASRLDYITRGTIYAAVCNHRYVNREQLIPEDDKTQDDSVDVIGQVSSIERNVLADPVVSYLLRHGTMLEQLDDKSDTADSAQAYVTVTVPAPASNLPYAIVSKDVNPIHVNPYAVVLAGLPTTIVHGMHSSAVGRRVIEQVTNGRVKRYRAAFVGMVHPGMALKCRAQLQRLKYGFKLVTLEMRDKDSGVIVLRASAQVSQPPTAYFFTGQGSAAVGMGMELYQTSAAGSPSRRVWDEADHFFTSKYGFSILDIVQSNPKRLKISFMGVKGVEIRKNWAALKVRDPTAGPNTEAYRFLYPGAMDPQTDGIEFYSEEGLLFQTQFQQPAILLAEKSAFEDLRAKGAIIEGTSSRFAGHSLGEYSAIACMVEGRGLSVPALAEVVFLRGLTMQSAVPRDELSRSRYGMVAVSPLRVGLWFTDEHFFQLIDGLQTALKQMDSKLKPPTDEQKEPDRPAQGPSQPLKQQERLLQVVNFNVKRTQYVVAGDLMALEALRLSLDALSAVNINSLQSMAPASAATHMLNLAKQAVNDAVSQADKKHAQTQDGFLALQKGRATIPLTGIDVPFHSRLLIGGVPSFKRVLLDMFSQVRVSPEDLVGRYIPNLVGCPFELTRPFATKVYEATSSSSTILKNLLDNPSLASDESWAAYYVTAQRREQLCALLVIELLAYQFASPVQWIKTQDELLAAGIRRAVEIGPSPVLLPMLSKSYVQERGEAALSDLQLLWSGRDIDAILCKDEGAKEDEAESKQEEEKSADPKRSEAIKPAVVVAAPVPAASVPSPAAAAPAASIPFSAAHSLRVIVSQKLKIPFADVAPSKNIRGLCGGKSALQNEILGDLSAEFAMEPEGADESPLSDLGVKLGASGKYTKPGKVLSTMINRMVQITMPGGFGMSQVKEYLKNSWGLDAGSSDGVLAHALTVKQASRLDSEPSAQAYLDRVVQDYASVSGVSLSRGGGGSTAGAAVGTTAVVMVDGKELVAIKNLLKQQAAALQAYLEEGSSAVTDGSTESSTEGEGEKGLLSVLTAEHGTKYVEGIRPQFDADKIRHYDSWWNWARQDCVEFLLNTFNDTVAVAPQNSKQVQKTMYLIANRAIPSVAVILANSVASLSPSHRKFSLLKELQQLVESRLKSQSVYIEYRHPSLPHTSVRENGEIVFSFTSRYPDSGFEGFVSDMLSPDNPNRLILSPAIAKDRTEVLFGRAQSTLSQAMLQLATKGLSFQGKTALITGAGEGSIGLAIARCLLMGGCHVIVTTSRPSRARWDMYRALYQEYGGKGSKLSVLPFNGASHQDVNSLVDALYEEDPHKGGLGVGAPDFVLPFAALNENGRDIAAVDEQSELAHRTMLTNVVRLIGSIKTKKSTVASVLGKSSVAGTVSRLQQKHTLIVLPLSPNHGLFGGDGLYSESKLALETLFNKWRSEGWGLGASMGLVGAEIGWTRGTGLMSTNDLIAQDIEKKTGLRTFDTTEMAFSIVALMSPQVSELSQQMPLKADLSGGFATLGGEGLPATELRTALMAKSAINKAVSVDAQADRDVMGLASSGAPKVKVPKSSSAPQPVIVDLSPAVAMPLPPGLHPRANLYIPFPPLSTPDQARHRLKHLEGMIDLSRVPVVVGFGEVGPWGSSRTRWEWELWGRFSAEGAIELARAMGLIRFHSGPLGSNNEEFVGWLDVKSGQPVADHEIAAKYHPSFIEHCGIRPIEPALFDDYDPKRKMFLQQVALEANMPPFEVSSEQELQYLQRQHGALLQTTKDGSRTVASLKKGAVIYVPKSLPFDREVAGQIPTGWNPTRYGLPKDLQVDPVTQYALAATIDAFISAGILDPYEIYQYVHVSEVGNSIGGGMGGMKSLKGIFRHRFMDQPNISSDILQETFINTTPAWINMLLLSSSGPIKTPVAACATAATSVEIGIETIKSGKARVMLTGGFEDFSEEGSYEFAQMKATSSSVVETKMGREPDEMCRPASSTRGGFMEAQGAGVQIVMSADLALEMGVPIYAILGGAFTATDRQGRSVPAPGQGILTTARETKSLLFTPDMYHNPLLDLDYRRQQLIQERSSIETWLKGELSAIDSRKSELSPPDQRASDSKAPSSASQLAALDARRRFVLRDADRRLRALQSTWGMDFFQGDPEIAPLRGCLSVWGLNVDDLEVVSFHGTGTKANDKNESEVVNLQMSHLGRRSGVPLFTVFQKWMTGHPKGAAAAWMLHGIVQCMLSGYVPGNRNADNVDHYLDKYEHLLYSNRTISVGRPLRAGYLHSFGFGQAGAELVVVHPDYVYAAVSDQTYEQYHRKRDKRELMTNMHWQQAMNDSVLLLAVKNRAPYGGDAQLEEKDQATYLDPTARTVYDPIKNQYSILKARSAPVSSVAPVLSASVSSVSSTVVDTPHKTLEAALIAVSTSVPALGTGIDVEELSTFSNKDEQFLSRNFTPAELSYAQASPNRLASLAARWCAKEAVIKCISSAATKLGETVTWKGGSAPLNEIEIVMSKNGNPTVKLQGYPLQIANQLRIGDFSLSLSHTATHAVAQVIASASAPASAPASASK